MIFRWIGWWLHRLLCYPDYQRTNSERSVVVGKWNSDNEVCVDCGLSRTALREMLIGNKGNRVTAHTAIENCPSCQKALGGKG